MRTGEMQCAGTGGTRDTQVAKRKTGSTCGQAMGLVCG